MRRRIGFALAAAVLLLVAVGPARALDLPSLSDLLRGSGLLERLFSPGALSEDHRKAACTTCHRPFKGIAREGCTTGDCHPPAKLGEARPAVVAVHERSSGRNCTACHRDHRGRLAELTVPFHESTPPAAQKDCASCHGAEAERAHPEIRAQRCLACHTSTADWQAISVDHAGLADNACADCHAAQARKAHPAITERRCEACHRSTADWKQVQVDHARLGSRACADCHAAQARKAHPAITERRCQACHRSTADWRRVSVDHRAVSGQSCANCHQGRKPADGLHASLGNTSCANCHNTSSWKPARFSHAALPAERRQRCADCHGALAQKAHPQIRSTDCAACHSPSAGWQAAKIDHARVSRDACATCHTPPATQIHALAKGTGCATCHSTGAWKPTTFRHPRIPEFREHMQLGCRACHPSTLSQAVSCTKCHGRGGFEDD